MKIEALKNYPYAQVDRKTGDVFDADDRDANILIKAGVAKRHVESRSFKSEHSGSQRQTSQRSRDGGSKRQSGRTSGYKRRDMRAEQ